MLHWCPAPVHLALKLLFKRLRFAQFSILFNLKFVSHIIIIWCLPNVSDMLLLWYVVPHLPHSHPFSPPPICTVYIPPLSSLDSRKGIRWRRRQRSRHTENPVTCEGGGVGEGRVPSQIGTFEAHQTFGVQVLWLYIYIYFFFVNGSTVLYLGI